MAIGDIFRVAVVGEFQFGQELVNTFHYKALNTPVFPTQAEDLAHAVQDGLLPLHASVRTVASGVTKVEVRGVTNPLEGFDLPISPILSGDQLGDSMPPQVSCVVTWTTGLVGRRFRGRTFMWPCAEGNQASGVINAGYEDQMHTFANGIQVIAESTLASFYQLVVWSEKFSIATEVTSHIIRTNLHTQRRRVAGVGS